MHYGVLMFATDYAIRPDELAVAAEERGFESVFFPEHTHIPASRKSPWPGGGELPKEYWHTHDLFVALAYAAAVTKKIKIGSGICLVVERDPILTAKARQRVVDFCDGWMPIGINPGGILEGMKDLAERARAADKKPSDFAVTVFGAPGNPDVLKQFAAAGVARAIFWVSPESREKVL